MIISDFSSRPWRNLPPTSVIHMATRRPAHNTPIHMDLVPFKVNHTRNPCGSPPNMINKTNKNKKPKTKKVLSSGHWKFAGSQLVNGTVNALSSTPTPVFLPLREETQTMVREKLGPKLRPPQTLYLLGKGETQAMVWVSGEGKLRPWSEFRVFLG